MYDRCEVDEKFLLIYTLLKLRYEVCIFWQYVGYYLAINEWIWGHFPFVRTDLPDLSPRDEKFTFDQNYPARSIKS